MVISAHKRGKLPVLSTRKIGPSLIFERLWEECGCKKIIRSLVKGRKFEFYVERALFLTVLHRIFESGSDRSADKWRVDYNIEGTEFLQLHHLYRAMAWLGEESPMLTKDRLEELLFSYRRDLFTSLDLVFFDTTSIYFEGNGGESLGEYGNSKDHRSDRRQIVVGAVLDDTGRPVCCEILPGNTADAGAFRYKKHVHRCGSWDDKQRGYASTRRTRLAIYSGSADAEIQRGSRGCADTRRSLQRCPDCGR
jgi:hypothetical protein